VSKNLPIMDTKIMATQKTRQKCDTFLEDFFFLGGVAPEPSQGGLSPPCTTRPPPQTPMHARRNTNTTTRANNITHTQDCSLTYPNLGLLSLSHLQSRFISFRNLPYTITFHQGLHFEFQLTKFKPSNLLASLR
jgi:hypothetical protein